MELNKVMLAKVGLLVFFIWSTASVDARSNPGSFITQLLLNGDANANYNLKSTTSVCCDECICTESDPPKCQCHDLGETCHSACKFCICATSSPPVCRCLDQNTFCYHKCDSSSQTKAH
ncbi:hypothetical protein VNO78_15320 [Psophocarpus tetragonolobus]|uniref:Bowman-Birk serine protease inhibitors family domain-containing protein n=1 Tax=Psophocarpus tetragonolobus TaxID=3891 RepID=A0AAN9XJS4_PSOTE